MNWLGSLLNGCYIALLTMLLPVVAWKRWRHGKYRQGWKQKLTGQLEHRGCSDAPARIWLHAVSVGEVLQLRGIVEQLRSESAECQILITTTTDTGYEIACRSYPDCAVDFFPLDFTWAVRRALDTFQPQLLVLVELELWPNLILEASRRQIPLALINGRLSERSFRGYRKIFWLVRKLLSKFALIAVQSPEYERRMRVLGANSNCVLVTGSIKFDGVETDRQNPATTEIRTWFGWRPGERLLVAGSTQAPEEEYALRIYSQLRHEFPDLRLALAPRHPERRQEVITLVHNHGLQVCTRTPSGEKVLPLHGSDSEVVSLLDTVGELRALWGRADLAFVGGSFTDRGGQNMIEPAAYGAAVCFGPNTWNFRQTVELFCQDQAVRVVKTPDELEAFLRSALHDPEAARAMGRRAQRLVWSQQGATRRTVAQLTALIPHWPSAMQEQRRAA